MHDNIAGCLCPSKLYGILAAGRPVLAIGPENADLQQVVRQHNIGWCCPPGDATAIATAVSSAATDRANRLAMSDRARSLAVQSYDRKVVTGQFANLLAEITDTIAAEPTKLPAIADSW
jgi:glycosyltransferase involved in cell wall biosynthesis